MPPLLTRIEREYIIRSLCTDLPELTVVTGTGVFGVQEYQCTEKEIFWEKQKYPDCVQNEMVKIFFSHKQRTLSFATRLNVTPQGIVCAISSSIAREDGVFSHTVRIFFPGLDGTRYAAFPDEKTQVSRHGLVENTSVERFDALGAKAGLNKKEYPALIFLDRYIKNIQSGKIRAPVFHDFAHIVHCDHRTLLAVFSSDIRNLPRANTLLPIRIHWEQRIITGNAAITAVFPVTPSSVMVVARLEKLQEEDKRFLFEKNYTEKYIGE